MDIKSPQGEARNEYTYSAGGVKLQTVQKWNPNYSTNPVIGSAVNIALLTQSKTTDYVGNKIYENGSLKRILVDGGYIEGGSYYFYLTDHLGNNRIVANQSGTVIQKNHYYPFGTTFAEATDQGKQPYKYNGKELDNERGLNLYDYSARYYESATGRFTTVDPLAEKYYSISPYAYCANNPVRFIDPSGMDIWEIDRKTGKIVWKKESDEHLLYGWNNDDEEDALRLSSGDILEQLSEYNVKFKGHMALTSSSEAGEVFLFGAEHSDVEWGLQGFSTDKGRRYLVMTNNKEKNVSTITGYEVAGFKQENMLFEVHSHPGKYGTQGAL